MVNKPKKRMDPVSEAAVEVVQVRQGEEDAVQAQCDRAFKVGLLTGRIQFTQAMTLVMEFLEWKHLAEIADGKLYLNIPGVTCMDDFLKAANLKRSTAYNQIRAGRILTVEEVQLLDKLGFTRKGLMDYARLPEDQRIKIMDGKIINGDKATKDEILQSLRDAILENKRKDEELKAQERVANRRIGDKEREIQKNHKEIDSLEGKLLARSKAREMTPREDQFTAWAEQRRIGFLGYMLTVEPTKIDLNNDDSPLMRAAYLELLGNMKRQIIAAYDTAEEMFGADMEERRTA